jgi:hypothetical protein
METEKTYETKAVSQDKWAWRFGYKDWAEMARLAKEGDYLAWCYCKEYTEKHPSNFFASGGHAADQVKDVCEALKEAVSQGHIKILAPWGEEKKCPTRY